MDWKFKNYVWNLFFKYNSIIKNEDLLQGVEEKGKESAISEECHSLGHLNNHY